MTSNKQKRLSLLQKAGDELTSENNRLTEESFATYAESLVKFERARSDRRSGVAAPVQNSSAPQPKSLEDLKATAVVKSPFAIKSE